MFHVLEYRIIVSLDLFEVFFFFWLNVWRYFNFATQHDDTMNWSPPPPNTDSLFIIHVCSPPWNPLFGPGHAAWYTTLGKANCIDHIFSKLLAAIHSFFFFFWVIAIHSNWNTTRSNIHTHSSHKILDISDFKYIFYFIYEAKLTPTLLGEVITMVNFILKSKSLSFKAVISILQVRNMSTIIL